MKAWKIDATEKRIYPVEILAKEPGRPMLNSLYETIGNNCGMMELVAVDENGDGLFIDEEGLFNPETTLGFIYECPEDKARFTICGNGLLLGGDDATGESVDVKATEAEVLPRVVRWLDENFIQGYKARFQ